MGDPKVRVHIPHRGEGTHTLLVAVPLDDDDWVDDRHHDRIVARVAARAREALRDATVSDPSGL